MVSQPVLDQITDLIVSDDVLNVRALRSLLYLEISSLIASPCDVLVEHRSAFNQRSTLPTLERTILETGQTLYAA